MFFVAYFEIEICPFFEKNGHITNGHIYEFSKKWAYCKWAYSLKLQNNGHIANGHTPKYAHLEFIQHVLKKNQISEIREKM